MILTAYVHSNSGSLVPENFDDGITDEITDENLWEK